MQWYYQNAPGPARSRSRSRSPAGSRSNSSSSNDNNDARVRPFGAYIRRSRDRSRTPNGNNTSNRVMDALKRAFTAVLQSPGRTGSYVGTHYELVPVMYSRPGERRWSFLKKNERGRPVTEIGTLSINTNTDTVKLRASSHLLDNPSLHRIITRSWLYDANHNLTQILRRIGGN